MISAYFQRALVFSFVCMFCACLPAAPNVLILNSYHPGYSWSDGELEGVLRALNRAYTGVIPDVEYLDTNRHHDPEYTEFLYGVLREKYRRKKFDILITLDDAALQVALKHRGDFGPNTPIVFGGVNNFVPELLHGERNITGVSEAFDFLGDIELIQRLRPNAKTIYVISDSSSSTIATRAAFERVTAPLRGRINFEEIRDWTAESLLDRLSRLPADQAAMIIGNAKDSTGALVSENEDFLRNEAARCTVPIFMITQPYLPISQGYNWEQAVWYGMGGRMLTSDVHGEAVAKLAIRVLGGESADQIPVVQVSPSRCAFDYPQLLRHQIDLSRLPPDAEVFNRPVSFYELYRAQILAGLSAIVALSAAVLGLTVTVIRRKRAERALREAVNRFELVARATHDAVWDLDLLQDRLWWNNEYTRLTGISDATPPSRAAWENAVHPEDRAVLFQRLLQPSPNESFVTLEHRVSRPEGDERHVLLRASFLRDETGKLERVVGSMLDLTDRKAAEVHRMKLEEQLRLAQKMEAIGTLAGGVAHDFNNMLQVISGNASLASDPNSTPSEIRESLHLIDEAAKRATQLTRQLLLFGRRQKPEAEAVDLRALSSELIRLLRRLIGEQYSVEQTAAPDLWPILADRGQLEQVIMNLCVNARDAMPHGGRIGISLSNALFTTEEAAKNAWARPGEFVRLAIEDEGVGMDEATQARIFEPFFTTKPKEKGTGLGLAVVFGIVAQHGGFLHVSSQVNVGSRFEIYLPRATVAPRPSGDRRPAYPKTGSGTILLAEDEDSVRLVMQKLLSSAGYKTLTASNGPEALDLAQKHRDEIDLAVLDVILPGMSGLDVYNTLLRLRPHLPIVFCSGYSADVLPRDFANRPNVYLVAKPFSASELLGAIQRGLQKLRTPRG